MKFTKLLKEFWENEDGFLPLVGLAITAIGIGTQVASTVIQGNKAEEAENARRGQERLEQQRERLRQVREARIRRAETRAAAEAQGASSSSSAQGALASIGTQLQSNLGFINATERNQSTVSRATLGANRAAQFGELGAAATKIGFATFDYSAREYRNDQQERKATKVPVP